jgi:hypothetical protein
MIYTSSLNHKGNRETFKDFFGCWVIVFQVFCDCSFSPFDPLSPTLEGHIWLISSSFSMIQLFVGAQIVGLKFLSGHEIRRTTLQKFANLWNTKCSVIGVITLEGFKIPQLVWITNVPNEPSIGVWLLWVKFSIYMGLKGILTPIHLKQVSFPSH